MVGGGGVFQEGRVGMERGYTELRRFMSPWKAVRLWRPVETELMADRRALQKHLLEGVSGQRPGEE